MYGYIYLTTNLVNNKKYVGMHKSAYFDPDYKGSGKILWQAIRKYGWENFKVELLVECETPEDLYKSEESEIKVRDAVSSPEYYNIKQGGNGGWKINGVSIKKGVKISDQARLNTSRAHQGVKLSLSHCKSISDSLKGDNNPLRGEGSEVARQNLSLAMRGNQNGKDHVWITNGTENRRILLGEKIPEGFWRGQTNPGFLQYNYRWMTKDCKNKRVREDEVNLYLSKGYVIGRYIPPRSATTIESVDGEKDSIE